MLSHASLRYQINKRLNLDFFLLNISNVLLKKRINEYIVYFLNTPDLQIMLYIILLSTKKKFKITYKKGDNVLV